MEKLVINIPESRSSIVKQILHGLGVAIQGMDNPVKGNYKQKLMNVATWTEADVNALEEGKKTFNNFKSEEW
jgi:hypothetical protein